MTNSKPNYRIGSYQAALAGMKIINSVEITGRNFISGDKTFCFEYDKKNNIAEGCSNYQCVGTKKYYKRLLNRKDCNGGKGHRFEKKATQLTGDNNDARECSECGKIIARGNADFSNMLEKHMFMGGLCDCVYDGGENGSGEIPRHHISCDSN